MIESAEEFVRLRTSGNPDDYNRASSEEASTEVWMEVAAQYPGMREWVVANKTVPLDILEKLANDESERVREAVAMKRKLSISLFRKLAKDSHFSVRQRIACNKKTPREILMSLIDDEDKSVKEAARRNME